MTVGGGCHNLKVVDNMRTHNKNKQLLKYSLFDKEVVTYERDENGDIIYDVIDGVEIPIETGDIELGYNEPKEFKACISASGGESEAKEFGLSMEDYNAVIVCEKGAHPLKEGSLVWHESEVGYVDEQVDENTADYTVIKVHKSLNLVKYILKARVK